MKKQKELGQQLAEKDQQIAELEQRRKDSDGFLYGYYKRHPEEYTKEVREWNKMLDERKKAELKKELKP